MFGFEYKTTFWTDFTIADHFGIPAIKGTYRRAFAEWKHDPEMVGELVVVLNHKIWQHYPHNESVARVYNELWMKADDWCKGHLKGDALRKYLEIID